MDPPQCVQNAMMTKDKKPFTYTPGGIDLSEVRSPRMARRIERNAHLGGAGDVPKPQLPPPQNMGPLPPSVQAVMRPQPQVQVFPSGPPPPPPMSRGGAPHPPPPPTCGPPPPPLPPTGPLPTQKVTTADNQVLERPDMTKIIPDNPMALLRKTGGPQPRKSLVDEIFAQERKAPPAPTTPPSVQQRPQQFEQQQPRYQPPVIDRGAPISPVPQQYQPVQPPQPQQYQYQSPPPPQRYPEPPEQPRYQPPVIERQPTIPRQNNGQPEVKTSTAHLGSLYIPPANQQQQQQPQRRVVSPPTPPERHLDSPSIQTPPLKEAPRPWQAKKVQQEEIPPWAKKDNQVPREREEFQNAYQSPSPPIQQQQPQQQRWPQSRPVQQSQPVQQPQLSQQLPGGVPVRIEIRTNTRPAYNQQAPQEPEDRKPEAVYITQPIVLQHPGPRIAPQQKQQRPPQTAPQQQRVDAQGARVIPIQVEGTNQGSRTPVTPGSDRSLTRQQSWGSNPTQSNSFKIIQKLTQTDDDDEVEDAPITEHAPKYPQNFQQVPADQLRRMKLNEGDQNLMNKFKQVVDEENYQREVDPRYRGPAIPSKAFKLLQNMTEGSPDPNYYAKPTVSRGPQPQGNLGPQVRTIPIQVEGDDSPQPYVHPSEQVVPEPKKYTGSSIPSRSFKILQAMTAPDNCANVEEQYEASPYEQWGYDPNYPPYPPPPYWHEYYYNYYYQDPQAGLSKEESSDASSKATPRQTPTPRHTPVPFWGYMPPYSYPTARRPSTVDGDSDAETITNPRSTPLPFYGYGYQYPECEEGNGIEETQMYPPYPPYFDPYYYSYYYGYPPMYPPYPYYGQTADTDDLTGYSSTDEMSSYNKRFTEKPARRNSFEAKNSRRVMTPTLNVKEKVVNDKLEMKKPEPEPEDESSDSGSDTETEEELQQQDNNSTPLKSIRSVSNIHVYADEDNNSHCSDEEVCIEEYSEETNEDVDEDNYIVDDDDESYPHQLSVIYEESERTESRLRSASAMSDSTTIAERSEDEDEHSPAVNLLKPFKFCVSVTEENKEEIKTVVSLSDREIKTFDDDNGMYPSFAVKSPSATPKERSLCRLDSSDENNADDTTLTEDSTTVDEENSEKAPVEVEIDDINAVIEEDDGKESDESEDWWGILGKEDDLPKPKPILFKRQIVEEETNTSIGDEPKKGVKEESKIGTKQEPKVDAKKQPKIEVKEEHLEETTIALVKNEEVVKPKNNYAKAINSVYDKLEEQFEDDENSGKLIEMESFVARLEQMQKESGLWNIQLPTKDKNKPVTVMQGSIKENKEKLLQSKTNNKNSIENQTSIPNTNHHKNVHKINDNEDDQNVKGGENKRERGEDAIETSHKLVSRNDNNDNSSASYSNYNCSKSVLGRNCEKTVLQQPITAEEKVEILYVEVLEDNIPEIIYPDDSNLGDDKHENKSDEESDNSSDDVESSSSEDETEEHQKEDEQNYSEEKELQSLSIKERIQALKEKIKQKQSKLLQEEETRNSSVKDRISAIETTNQTRSKTTSTKSSVKSFEDYSEEEEGDSGVTSDMSRHISDTEEFPELKKLTRYQRAATHSRLFKLLQDECENEDEEEVDNVNTAENGTNLSSTQRSEIKEEAPRRDQLSLPLKKTNETESLCSSGINSPVSPVNERLVNELVQSLLKRKKGQIFRNMPKEKLYAAALRILQEDMEGLETTSEDFSSFLSPLRGSTGCSTAAQTPQEFNGNYDEYKQYYETWSEAEKLYDENYDILPSKAFKLLQEHSNLSKTGTIAGLLGKCPRVLSSKNVHKRLMKLLESSDCPSPTPEHPLESNEVTSAS